MRGYVVEDAVLVLLQHQFLHVLRRKVTPERIIARQRLHHPTIDLGDVVEGTVAIHGRLLVLDVAEAHLGLLPVARPRRARQVAACQQNHQQQQLQREKARKSAHLNPGTVTGSVVLIWCLALESLVLLIAVSLYLTPFKARPIYAYNARNGVFKKKQDSSALCDEKRLRFSTEFP